MASLPPLSIKRGTDVDITITLPDAISATGATVYLTVKKLEDMKKRVDSDEFAVIKKIITTHVGQVFSSTIEHDDTNDAQPGRYLYGISVKDSTGKVKGTKANGEFTIEPRDTADMETS